MYSCLFLRDKRATSLVFCMCHKFFVCVCLSSFVVYLWCVVFVVLTVFSLSVSLLLLILYALFVIIDKSLFACTV